MISPHPNPEVETVLRQLRAYYQSHIGADDIPSAPTFLVGNLRNALYATGTSDYEAAVREISRLVRQCARNSERLPLSMHIRQWRHYLWLAVAVAMLLLARAVLWAEPLELLSCAEINLLGPACEGDVPVDEPAMPVPPQHPEEPLFTLQTMRPDTPPLLVKVFNDPSEENIAAFKAWQHRYLSRTLEVERLLKEYDQRHK